MASFHYSISNFQQKTEPARLYEYLRAFLEQFLIECWKTKLNSSYKHYRKFFNLQIFLLATHAKYDKGMKTKKIN